MEVINEVFVKKNIGLVTMRTTFDSQLILDWVQWFVWVDYKELYCQCLFILSCSYSCLELYCSIDSTSMNNSWKSTKISLHREDGGSLQFKGHDNALLQSTAESFKIKFF